MLTGLILGLLLGAIGFLFAWLPAAASRPTFGLVIGLAILGICVWANGIGALVPLLARRFGIDPALVSAPLISTLVDTTGLVIFYSIAIVLLIKLACPTRTPSPMIFAEMTAPEIRALPRESTLVVAPIAATRAARAAPAGLHRHDPRRRRWPTGSSGPGRPGRCSCPVLWLGASDHHLPFGGTLTATLPTYEQMLVDLLTPLLRDGFRRAMILNGHGGNIDPLRVALRRLDVEFPRAILTGAAYWDLAAAELAALCRGPRKEMGHACEIETSMILHLRPDLVRLDLIATTPTPPRTASRGSPGPATSAGGPTTASSATPSSADAENGPADARRRRREGRRGRPAASSTFPCPGPDPGSEPEGLVDHVQQRLAPGEPADVLDERLQVPAGDHRGIAGGVGGEDDVGEVPERVVGAAAARPRRRRAPRRRSCRLGGRRPGRRGRRSPPGRC